MLMCMVSYFCGFQHWILGSKLLSQNEPGTFHTNVEQCSWYLNVSHRVSGVGILTKELQIQNSGSSVSLYNDWYVDDSESLLSARWEFQYTGRHIEIDFC